MGENRLTKRLADELSAGHKCLMPYLTAGFPDLASTAALIERFDAIGCPAIEIGFPFSDSIADGPVIQESFYRALEGGFRVDDLFEAVRTLRPKVSTALIAMVSMSLVTKRGVACFARDAAGAGFDALIVPDVPVDESDSLDAIAEKAGLCNVLMDAPTALADRRRRIAQRTRGFLYVIAQKGITGERDGIASGLAGHIASLRTETDTPLIAGFGISTPEQVREVTQHADGAIVGSAIVRRMTQCIEDKASRDALVEALGTYVAELHAATRI